MAEPMTPDTFVQILRAEGVNVIEHRDWRTHTRTNPDAGRYFGPVNGVILHHTVSSGTLSSVNLCYDGYSGLPGPLCHGVIAKNGDVYAVGTGRTNHAGGGDPDVLNAVVNEDYFSTPPTPDVGNDDGVDGNRRFYGFECINLGDGVDPWPDEQVDAMVRASAAICRHYGWSAKSTIGHKEWSDDKSDPRGPGTVVAMTRLRSLIQERLSHPADWNPDGATTPTTPETGTAVTNTLVLVRTTNASIPPGTTREIYWEEEYKDTGNEHGAGGKTIATSVFYNGTLTAHIIGLPAGQAFQVYASEEDPSGTVIGQDAVACEIVGRPDGGAIKVKIPFTGYVWNRLVFRVRNDSDAIVTLDRAEVGIDTRPVF